jgi:hypothetical protein
MEGETQWENPTPTRPVCLLQEDWQLEEWMPLPQGKSNGD